MDRKVGCVASYNDQIEKCDTGDFGASFTTEFLDLPMQPMKNCVSASSRWADLYNQVPLCDVPRHYAGMNASPFLLDYLTEVLRVCPRNGRTLETGIGSGYGAIWLSERGIQAEGIDYSQTIVERAKQINNLLGGTATFRFGDIFDFYWSDTSHYDVVHHQGVLEHFTVPQIRAALSQQVARANHVVFSVPSVNYPFDPEFGDERLIENKRLKRSHFQASRMEPPPS